jgi:UbiD family decarboxylase
MVQRRARVHDFDATAALEQLTRQGRFPTVLWTAPENVLGEPCGFHLVSDVFARRERCAEALGLPAGQAGLPLSLEFARLAAMRVPAETVPQHAAPLLTTVWRGAEADVRRRPVVRHFGMDLGPVLTMAVVLRDPDEGLSDVSFCKGFLQGPHRLGLSIHTPHLGRIAGKHEQRGLRAPVAVILGHHPALWLGSLALTPFGTNDYDAIGSFLREPLRLTASATLGPDFLIPADAEIVIEGEILPGERKVCDPFGEGTRHYQGQCLRPVMDLSAIAFRRGAILQDIFSGHEGHWNLGAIPKEGSVYNALQRRFGNIAAVCLPHSGCGRFMVYVAMRKAREGYAKLVGHAALLEFFLVNVAVVVDEDIDVFHEPDVLWAVATNVDPSRDVDLVRNAHNNFTTAMRNTKVVIDATQPLDVDFPARIKVPDAARARIRPEEWLCRGEDLLGELSRLR